MSHETVLYSKMKAYKGPVKLITRVKIAHSFLQSVSDQSTFRPGGEGGNGPPERKFTKLGGKGNFGVLSSKLNVILAKRGPSASF